MYFQYMGLKKDGESISFSPFYDHIHQTGVNNNYDYVSKDFIILV